MESTDNPVTFTNIQWMPHNGSYIYEGDPIQFNSGELHSQGWNNPPGNRMNRPLYCHAHQGVRGELKRHSQYRPWIARPNQRPVPTFNNYNYDVAGQSCHPNNYEYAKCLPIYENRKLRKNKRFRKRIYQNGGNEPYDFPGQTWDTLCSGQHADASMLPPSNFYHENASMNCTVSNLKRLPYTEWDQADTMSKPECGLNGTLIRQNCYQDSALEPIKILSNSGTNMCEHANEISTERLEFYSIENQNNCKFVISNNDNQKQISSDLEETYLKNGVLNTSLQATPVDNHTVSQSALREQQTFEIKASNVLNPLKTSDGDVLNNFKSKNAKLNSSRNPDSDQFERLSTFGEAKVEIVQINGGNSRLNSEIEPTNSYSTQKQSVAPLPSQKNLDSSTCIQETSKTTNLVPESCKMTTDLTRIHNSNFETSTSFPVLQSEFPQQTACEVELKNLSALTASDPCLPFVTNIKNIDAAAEKYAEFEENDSVDHLSHSPSSISLCYRRMKALELQAKILANNMSSLYTTARHELRDKDRIIEEKNLIIQSLKLQLKNQASLTSEKCKFTTIPT